MLNLNIIALDKLNINIIIEKIVYKKLYEFKILIHISIKFNRV